jgi:hypothetical protein
MDREFVTYEQSVALKELGFDEPCFFAFDNCSTPMRCSDLRTNEQKFYGVNYNSSTYTSQPTYSQAFRFFREKYGILSYIEASPNNTFDYVTVSDDFEEKDYDDGPFKTYEEAEQSCLNKLIEMVKTKNK